MVQHMLPVRKFGVQYPPIIFWINNLFIFFFIKSPIFSFFIEAYKKYIDKHV